MLRFRNGRSIDDNPEHWNLAQWTKDAHTFCEAFLYLTNTTNLSHLLEVAKETADAMINTEVTFVPFENCGLVQHDTKEQGVHEIKKFLERYYF